MPLLTPGEYDDLPQNIKDELAAISPQPTKDVKDNRYQRKKGRFMNGQVGADTKSLQQIGFGTGSPSAPHYPDDGDNSIQVSPRG